MVLLDNLFSWKNLSELYGCIDGEAISIYEFVPAYMTNMQIYSRIAISWIFKILLITL